MCLPQWVRRLWPGSARSRLRLTIQHLFLSDFSQLAGFFVSATICLATYLAIVVGLFRVTRPLKLAFSLLRDLIPMRSRGGSS